MKLSDFEYKIKEGLKPLLYDFSITKSSNTFVKKQKENIFKIELIIRDTMFGCKIEIYIYIYNKKISDIYNKISNSERKKYFFAVGGSLATIMNNKGDLYLKQYFLDYEIEDEGDISKFISYFSKVYNEFIKIYFEKFSNLEEIDQGLNTQPTKSVVHRATNPYRCIVGIIAAKLVNRPNYEELVKIYRNEISVSVKDEDIIDYENIVDFLSELK